MKKVLIIGAGPAGLTAGWRLLEQAPDQYHPLIVEVQGRIGGLACTIDYKGNRLDLGGHRFFTKNREVEKAWFSLAPNHFQKRNRISRILFMRRLFEYPIQLSASTIAKLGLARTFSAGISYLSAVMRKRPEHSLEDFYINRFGTVLYRLFFEKYTEKLWGVHPHDLSPEWGAQRVKGLSLRRALTAFFSNTFRRADHTRQETSLIDWFYYPTLGPGQYWEQMAEVIRSKGGELALHHKVIGFDTAPTVDGSLRIVSALTHDTVTGATEHRETDVVMSSMPIKDLIASLGEVVPPHIREIAHALPYRDFMTVGLLVDRLALDDGADRLIPDNWIYIQEPDVALGRIQVFNNWSQEMVASPEDTVWIGLEYFCHEGDSMWTMDDRAFVALAVGELTKLGIIEPEAVLDATVVRVQKAYPAYYGTYERLGEVRAFLDTIENLYCIGRNGQHRYNNMDHSMLTSFEAVRAVIDPDYGRSRLWSVNAEEIYHEDFSRVDR